MARAARVKRQGIILTWVYGKSADDASLKRVVRQARKYNGRIFFVHLICDQDELLRRVKSPSRKAFGKVKTHKTLRGIMKRHDIFSEVPYELNFVIDNTKISPRQAAKLIQGQYRL